MTKRKQVALFLWPHLRDQLSRAVDGIVWQKISYGVRSRLDDDLWHKIYESLKND